MRRTGIFKAGFLLAVYAATSLMAGCVIATPDGDYREGYYDRPHNRWYHDHGWVECRRDDFHCRGGRDRDDFDDR